LEESGLLAENCIIIAESRKTLTLADEYQRLRLLKRRDYGDTAIWYYNFLGEE
jgi:16S rRNA G966 N2-methylase RsmD